MSPLRCILLVGEGNFSFSASLCQSLSGSDTVVTATCLQQENEALRHEGSADNIHIIREAGGTVLFDIDCTKLGECMPLKGHLFHLVIFNFPHCGKKSGVKKNRELLKNFFLSCVQVLSEDGEIHVSLCNGQGGTPADQPKREWHNSWQVAAMAAEAHLILSDVRPFETEKYQSYKCTGYRSQDKGFHVEKALLHVFTRSLPYIPPQRLTVEETVEEEKVQYQIPAELSDYMFRYMLTQCYLIQLLQRDNDSESHSSGDKNKCTILRSNSWTKKNDEDSLSSAVSSEKVDKPRNKGTEVLKPVRSLDVDPEIEAEYYVLRPSLMPALEDWIAKHKALTADCDEEAKSESSETLVAHSVINGKMCSLWGISDLVFRNVPINTWALPVFHELLLKAVFPSEPDPLKMFCEHLEKLLGPYGVSVSTEQGDFCIMAQPMGLVGKIFPVKEGECHSFINLCISLNLDLLAVLLFALPDWRLLWSHDPRFYKQFFVQPSPGAPFCPFSLFPEHFRFDISFWTGPCWDERKFYSVVREASCGTVQQVKLIDTFSHPDLSQTSYCYRLVYHSHTHALSHTQALLFHKQLETMLSTWLQVTVR
uniref:FDX-ACB domain-containing protein n=1 Tax=Periophthalmus magnuspinnatus TaxID=409849 RepID=A0A3B3ZN90_9GOBI